MPIGPVQLLVVGFNHPDFQGQIRAELDRLHDNDLVRVIDALAVHNDAHRGVEALHQSQLSGDDQAAFGARVGRLIGLGAAGEEAARPGSRRGRCHLSRNGPAGREKQCLDHLAEWRGAPPGAPWEPARSPPRPLPPPRSWPRRWRGAAWGGEPPAA
jgi:hypothetical protein